MIYFGNLNLQAIRVGEAEITRAYAGEQLIYTNSNDNTLTFKCLSDGEVTVVSNIGQINKVLEYNINDSGWNSWLSLDVTLSLQAKDVIKFRGFNPSGFNTPDNYYTIRFTRGEFAYSGGSITSLLDSTGNMQIIPSAGCFCHLFEGSDGLVKAPKLPFETLTADCYAHMFSGCTNLRQMPSMKATTLASNCYTGMFEGCTSLTEINTLPIMELQPFCYSHMFEACTGLTAIKADKLPATTPVEGAYNSMFMGCLNLSELGINLTAFTGTEDWVNGVATTGTFYNIGGAEIQFGDNAIPEGWDVKSAYMTRLTLISCDSSHPAQFLLPQTMNDANAFRFYGKALGGDGGMIFGTYGSGSDKDDWRLFYFGSAYYDCITQRKSSFYQIQDNFDLIFTDHNVTETATGNVVASFSKQTISGDYPLGVNCYDGQDYCEVREITLYKDGVVVANYAPYLDAAGVPMLYDEVNGVAVYSYSVNPDYTL